MKLPIKKLFQEANFLSLAGNAIVAVFGIVGFAIMARSFETKVFGEWVLFISSVAFIEMFRFGVTNTALVRYISGADEEDRFQLIGSNAVIGFLVACGISFLLFIVYQLFKTPLDAAGYRLFFTWYPLIVFLNLPYNAALVILQADMQFGRILLLRLIESVVFFTIQWINFLIFRWELDVLIWGYMISIVGTSIYAIIKKWDGLRHYKRATRATNKKILDFGKYTTFTLVFTNLLRNADAFLISLSPLGTAGVALYGIPMKLNELQQLPLRSFAATAFPRMSKASMQEDTPEVKRLFDIYSGALTYLFIVMSLLIFIFAEFLVTLLGGAQYEGMNASLGVSAANILRIFSLYGLLLPLDRMTGVGLDSVNKPNKNMVKVMFMVVTNIIGDLVALFVFQSLEMVAMASVLFTFIGIVLGSYYLKMEFPIRIKDIYREGFLFYQTMFFRFLKR